MFKTRLGVAPRVRERSPRPTKLYRAGHRRLTRPALAERADVPLRAMRAAHLEIDQRFPGLLITEQEQAFEVAEACWTAGTPLGMSLNDFAKLAGVSLASVRAVCREIERRFPGVVVPEIQRLLAVARERWAAGDRGLDIRSFAKLANSSAAVVSYARPEIDRQCPGLLDSGQERLFAVAEASYRAGRRGLLPIELAASAHTRHHVVTDRLVELNRRFPGLVITDRELLLQGAQAWYDAGLRAMTVDGFAARARISRAEVSSARPEIDEQYPGLLSGD